MYNSEKPGFPGKEDPMHANQVQEGWRRTRAAREIQSKFRSQRRQVFSLPKASSPCPVSSRRSKSRLEKANRVHWRSRTQRRLALQLYPAPRVNARSILQKTYLENGLSGKIEIDWGPSEGGGG